MLEINFVQKLGCINNMNTINITYVDKEIIGGKVYTNTTFFRRSGGTWVKYDDFSGTSDEIKSEEFMKILNESVGRSKLLRKIKKYSDLLET